MKKILLAASECVPFIKTGGLADVIGALPKYFNQNEYDVRVILPKYSCIENEENYKFKQLASFTVTLNWRHQYAGVSSVEMDGITFYFIENNQYFNVDKPYGQIHEDAEKFAFFCKASLIALPLIDFCPDIIHCNDWQTGLLPVFLKEQFQGAFYSSIKTIFTIHNMRFQGRWSIDAYKDITGLPDYCFTYEKLESYGDGNPFKGGVVYADWVTTVSNNYANEIQTKKFGEGLEGLMEHRKERLSGIVNGLDVKIYNPKEDMMLSEPFDTDTVREKKPINKKALQKELGLREDVSIFLIGMVSRITDQKGFDLVVDKIEEILKKEDIQIAIQGTGDPVYQDQLRVLAARYPGKMAVRIQYSEMLARQIYGSSDGFLMPSLFEPCGLSQLISLRYGAVPIVRGTGGLKDTVIPYDKMTQSGIGFVFDDFDGDSMMKAILEAYQLFKTDRNEWDALVKRCMRQDYSWDASVMDYVKLYDSITSSTM